MEEVCLSRWRDLERCHLAPKEPEEPWAIPGRKAN